MYRYNTAGALSGRTFRAMEHCRYVYTKTPYVLWSSRGRLAGREKPRHVDDVCIMYAERTKFPRIAEKKLFFFFFFYPSAAAVGYFIQYTFTSAYVVIQEEEKREFRFLRQLRSNKTVSVFHLKMRPIPLWYSINPRWFVYTVQKEHCSTHLSHLSSLNVTLVVNNTLFIFFTGNTSYLRDSTLKLILRITIYLCFLP